MKQAEVSQADWRQDSKHSVEAAEFQEAYHFTPLICNGTLQEPGQTFSTSAALDHALGFANLCFGTPVALLSPSLHCSAPAVSNSFQNIKAMAQAFLPERVCFQMGLEDWRSTARTLDQDIVNTYLLLHRQCPVHCGPPTPIQQPHGARYEPQLDTIAGDWRALLPQDSIQ